jgi:hypothetical protein
MSKFKSVTKNQYHITILKKISLNTGYRLRNVWKLRI